MIAHIAEAGEARGRIVLQLSSRQPNSIALAAAIRIAQAYHSEIESLFVEDQNLIELGNFPFAREISLGGQQRDLTADTIEREIRYAFAAVQRHLQKLANLAEVPIKRRIVRGDPVQALQKACADCGPWNFIALADPFSSQSSLHLQSLFATVRDATGLLVVGPRAKRCGGRVVIMTDQSEPLPNMLRVANNLAALDDAEILISLFSESEEALQALEANARLLIGDSGTRAITTTSGLVRNPEAACELLRRQMAGFVIARMGDSLLPVDGSLRALSLALECPLVLVR